MNLSRLLPHPPLSSLLSHSPPQPYLPLLPILHTRPASHASQGRANKAAQGPGKRLGAKKSASELVVPGNIIFRQRGTHWFAGENCGMGRDHTIFSRERGYVTYYKDPERHPERKFIGVVFERGQTLPRPRGAARRRRLGVEVVEGEEGGAEEGGIVEEGGAVLKAVQKLAPQVVPRTERKLAVGKGYMYRETNWSIGRAAEKAKVRVSVYKPRDRFLAWRKTVARKASNAEKRGMRRR